MIHIPYGEIGGCEYPTYLIENLENGIKGFKRTYEHEFALAAFTTVDEDSDSINDHVVLVLPRKGKVIHYINDAEHDVLEFLREDIDEDDVKIEILDYVMDICDEYDILGEEDDD